MVGSATDLIFENAGQPQNILARIAGMGFGVVILGSWCDHGAFGFAFGVLVGNPIQVGSSRFFMQAREASSGMGEVFYAFRQKAVLECRADHVRDECEDLSLGTSFCDPGHCKIL
ncbi:MAG: hypothetical protein ACLR6B_15455 [Blautia sp.]